MPAGRKAGKLATIAEAGGRQVRSSTVGTAGTMGTVEMVNSEELLFNEQPPQPSGEAAKPAAPAKAQRLVTVGINKHTKRPKKNGITTTTYTWWNFLPKNLFLQFMKAANQYFLLIAVLASIPSISPIDPFSSWTPLFFVLIVSGLKDLYEDMQRRISDREVNNRRALVVRDGATHPVKFKNIKQGDIVMLLENDPVPADMVLLSTSDEVGDCYVETSNMDGESNYKLYSALSATQQFNSPELVSQLVGEVVCEESHVDFHKFHGRLVVESAPEGVGPIGRGNRISIDSSRASMDLVKGKPREGGADGPPVRFAEDTIEKKSSLKKLDLTSAEEEKKRKKRVMSTVFDSKTPVLEKTFSRVLTKEDTVLERQESKHGVETAYSLTYQNVLLRGSSVKATKWVMGVVVYSGRWTKLMKNQKKPRSKFSRVEKTMNLTVYCIFAWQLSFCLMGSIASIIFHEEYTADMPYFLSYSDTNWYEVGGLNFMTYLLLYNIMIPMSLWTTFEVIRLIQGKWMQYDLKMCSDPSNFSKTHLQVKTSSLVDDLGQIGYVFSDKTGTLTENRMEFSKLWIPGKVLDEGNHPGGAAEVVAAGGPLAQYAHDALIILSTCHTALAEWDDESQTYTYQAQSPDEVALVKTARNNGYVYSMNKIKRPSGGIVQGRMVHRHLGGASGGTNGAAGGKRSQANGGAARNIIGRFLCGSSDGKPLEGGSGSNRTSVVMEPGQMVKGSSHDLIPPKADQEPTTPGTPGTPHVDTLVPAFCAKAPPMEDFYKILAVLEFDSYRKRMSVIVRRPDGQVVIHSKGADVTMIEVLKKDTPSDVLQELKDNIDVFAREGLRTLVLGKRHLDRKYFTDWSARYAAAQDLMDGREEEMTKLAVEIESDLELVASTAVEDKLQDEVPETLRCLLKGGIIVWLLTGDKQETAINIGFSSGLIEAASEQLVINHDNEDETHATLLTHLKRIQDYGVEAKKLRKNADFEETPFTIIIDGKTLQFVLDSASMRRTFYEIATGCKSVIVARASPRQKALVVKMVKRFTKKLTLAIGDGANDVVMIKEAHVGVGIAGQEGTQAVRSADFAFHQFRFLRRLLMVHGRYSYIRNSTYVQYFLYKNLTFVLGHFWFGFWNGYSGQIVHDSWVQASYNVVFTSIAPLILAFFEKDVKEELLDEFPQLYRRLTEGSVLMNPRTMATWFANAIVHSGILFFGTLGLTYNSVTFSDGTVGDLWFFSTILSTATLITVNLKIGLIQRTWVWLTHASIIFSIVSYFLFVMVYNTMGPLSYSTLALDFHKYQWVWFKACESGVYWLGVPLLVVICLLPDYIYMYYSRRYWKKDWQYVQEADRRENPQCCGFSVKSVPLVGVRRRTNVLPKDEGDGPASTDLEKGDLS